MGKNNYENAKYWAMLVSVFLMISKVMGFFRDVLTARSFGAGHESDAYFTAMSGIIIVIGALGAGLQTTLVPIFSDIKKNHGREGKNKYFSNILSVTLLVMTIITVLMFALAGPFARILAIGYEGEMHDLIVFLIRQGLPIGIFLGITYVSNAYLQSDEVYGPHALMGIPYNLIFIIYLLVAKKPTVVGLMNVTMLASASQFLIQLPALRSRRLRFKFNLNFNDAYLKRTFILVVPIIISSTVSQINIMIDKTLASTLTEGAISALNYANKVNTLVVSVFVVAITTVVFPKLTNAVLKRDVKETGTLFSSSVNLVQLVTIPATIGLIVLNRPIIGILFQRGAFDEKATILTSGALLFYAPGLIGQSLRMCFENMFYSYQQTKIPMYTGFLTVILNIIFNLILIKPLGHRGLALATSLSMLITSIIMYFIIRKKVKFNEKETLLTFLKILLSGILMGVATHFMWEAFTPMMTSRMKEVMFLFVTIMIAILIYIVSTMLFGVKDTRTLVATVKRKFGRKNA